MMRLAPIQMAACILLGFALIVLMTLTAFLSIEITLLSSVTLLPPIPNNENAMTEPPVGGDCQRSMCVWPPGTFHVKQMDWPVVYPLSTMTTGTFAEYHAAKRLHRQSGYVRADDPDETVPLGIARLDTGTCDCPKIRITQTCPCATLTSPATSVNASGRVDATDKVLILTTYNWPTGGHYFHHLDSGAMPVFWALQRLQWLCVDRLVFWLWDGSTLPMSWDALGKDMSTIRDGLLCRPFNVSDRSVRTWHAQSMGMEQWINTHSSVVAWSSWHTLDYTSDLGARPPPFSKEYGPIIPELWREHGNKFDELHPVTREPIWKMFQRWAIALQAPVEAPIKPVVYFMQRTLGHNPGHRAIVNLPNRAELQKECGSLYDLRIIIGGQTDATSVEMHASAGYVSVFGSAHTNTLWLQPTARVVQIRLPLHEAATSASAVHRSWAESIVGSANYMEIVPSQIMPMYKPMYRYPVKRDLTEVVNQTDDTMQANDVSDALHTRLAMRDQDIVLSEAEWKRAVRFVCRIEG